MPPPTVHARILHRRIGIASIPLDSIDMHQHQRHPTADHVSSLKADLAKDVNSRWAYPIDLVVGADVPIPWLLSLGSNRLTTIAPEIGRFICIGGQHRLLAARQLRDEWEPSEENVEMDPSSSFYPANVYETVVLDDEELSVWMTERNVARLSLHVTLRQRLMVLSDLQSVDLQLKALGLLGWSSKDAGCIVSLRASSAWDGIMALLDEPLYEDTASGTIVDWSVEYRSYPILRLLLDDILQQQSQLRAMAKPDTRVTMDLLFGANSAQNQHVRKTGTGYILSKILNTTPNATWMHFEVNSFTDFWNGATLRSVQAPGLDVGTPFVFSRMIPSIHDINYHSFSSPLSDRMHRCEIAASSLHIILSYPSLFRLPARRPKRPDLEVDWVDILVGGSPGMRAQGEQIIRELLINIDVLVPPENQPQSPVKHDEFPHMIVLTDKSKLGHYVNSCSTPDWDKIIGFCVSLRFTVSAPVLGLRTHPQSSHPSSQNDTDEDGESERGVDSHNLRKRAPPESSKTVVSRTSRPESSSISRQDASGAARAETPKAAKRAQLESSPEPVTVAKQTKKRKGAKSGGVQVIVSTPGGTIVDQGRVTVRANNGRRATRATSQVARGREVIARRSTPNSQAAPNGDERRVATTLVQGTPDDIPSSQPIVEMEDDLGRVWDSYRLQSSPSRAMYVNGGRAYQDRESGRLNVVRNPVIFSQRSQDVTSMDRHDEELSSSRYFLTFAARLRDMTPADADMALEMCGVEKGDIDHWHEGLDEALGQSDRGSTDEH